MGYVLLGFSPSEPCYDMRVVSLQIPPAASPPLPDVKLCSLAAYPPSVGRRLYPPLPRTWSCEQALYRLPPLIPSQRTTLNYCWSSSWFLACRLGQPRSRRREHPYHPMQTCKSQKSACSLDRKGRLSHQGSITPRIVQNPDSPSTVGFERKAF